jgi:MEMO1 family protein
MKKGVNDMKNKSALVRSWCFAACFLLILNMVMPAEKCYGQVRPPAVDGQFYPADPVQLAQEVRQKLDATADLHLPKVLGLVVPHAGYQFSAATAAVGYKQVAGQAVDLVVVIAPSHHDDFQGVSIYPGDAYETPLGQMPIDKEAAKKLAAVDKNIHLAEYGHRAEHAVEVQLPFVQILFPQAKLLPMVVGPGWDWRLCETVGKAIADVVKQKKVLIIASTDLYHGYTYRDCVAISGATVEAMARLQPEALCSGFLSGQYQACGAPAVVMMQVAAKLLGATDAKQLAQTNSNDVTGTKGGYVVGYGAVAVYTGKTNTSDRKRFEPLPLDVQKYLLKSARQTLVDSFKGQQSKSNDSVSKLLDEKRGVFVTLTQDGRLRGCIGHHESDVPLCQLVPQIAKAAAFEDPRFPSLSADELDRTLIKISVYLTNVYRINSLDEFKMGEDGIILRKGGYGATYLPEVPLEAGWKTVDEEMVSLCQKAGLPANAWKSGAEFWVYRTQVFDESILKK